MAFPELPKLPVFGARKFQRAPSQRWLRERAGRPGGSWLAHDPPDVLGLRLAPRWRRGPRLLGAPADPAGVVRGAVDSLQPGTRVGARPARCFKPPIRGRVVTQHGQRTRRRWPGAWGVFPRTGKNSGIVSPAERRAAAAQTPGKGPWEPPLAPALDRPAESQRGLALRDTAPGPGRRGDEAAGRRRCAPPARRATTGPRSAVLGRDGTGRASPRPGAAEPPGLDPARL